MKVISVIILLTMYGCQGHNSSSYNPTQLSNESGIEQYLINLLEKETGKTAKHLTTEYMAWFHSSDPKYNQEYPNKKSVKIPGVYVTLKSKINAVQIIKNIRTLARKSGCEVFISEENFIDKTINLAIARNRNKWDIIKWQQTEGINYQIDNDSIISILRNLDKRIGLEIIGSDYDWCELEIKNMDLK